MYALHHRRLPFTVGVDEHAFYLEAFATCVKEKVLASDCKQRRVSYFLNIASNALHNLLS